MDAKLIDFRDQLRPVRAGLMAACGFALVVATQYRTTGWQLSTGLIIWSLLLGGAVLVKARTLAGRIIQQTCVALLLVLMFSPSALAPWVWMLLIWVVPGALAVTLALLLVTLARYRGPRHPRSHGHSTSPPAHSGAHL